MDIYNDLNGFLKEKFGAKVYKVSVEGGFSCPNLDGKLSENGCTFCNNESITPLVESESKSLLEQLKQGMDYIRKRHGADKFIAYLQRNSNTYGNQDRLRDVYETLVSHEDVLALAISTRPDCIDEAILDLIGEIQKKKYVWLELGLQSSFDDTLRKINRNHEVSAFLKAFRLAKERNIPVCVHIIFGLPGESREMMLQTVRLLSDLKVFGIKIHSLHIVKDTRLYEDYLKGEVKLMSLDDYVSLVADALEILPADTVIHRLTGEGPKSITVAPEWTFNKMDVVNRIKAELKKRNSYQGIKCRD